MCAGKQSPGSILPFGVPAHVSGDLWRGAPLILGAGLYGIRARAVGAHSGALGSDTKDPTGKGKTRIP